MPKQLYRTLLLDHSPFKTKKDSGIKRRWANESSGGSRTSCYKVEPRLLLQEASPWQTRSRILFRIDMVLSFLSFDSASTLSKRSENSFILLARLLELLICPSIKRTSLSSLSPTDFLFHDVSSNVPCLGAQNRPATCFNSVDLAHPLIRSLFSSTVFFRIHQDIQISSN